MKKKTPGVGKRAYPEAWCAAMAAAELASKSDPTAPIGEFVNCPKCKGTGEAPLMRGTGPCPTCGGSGEA
jgi:RecJ-like exonuclease